MIDSSMPLHGALAQNSMSDSCNEGANVQAADTELTLLQQFAGAFIRM